MVSGLQLLDAMVRITPIIYPDYIHHFTEVLQGVVSFSAISCEGPPRVEHGTMMVYSGVELGCNIVYKCHRGYRPLTNDDVTCLINGSWTVAPVCVSETTTPAGSTGRRI